MNQAKQSAIWFITGSQHLYGDETLRQVQQHADEIGLGLGNFAGMPVNIVVKDIVKTPEEIYAICQEANHAADCIGIIAWMHTFSPAKMWIRGLSVLHKPLCHLHTQFNLNIPWDGIDMDFMNLNQSAHGDREFGFMMTRMRINRKVIVGHWQQPDVIDRLGKSRHRPGGLAGCKICPLRR
jgi:L-arabinose isomerase